VQSAALHPETGELWTVEHGPRGGDEINRPEAGKNYGWPIITYGIDYSGAPIGAGITQQEGMEQPVYYWDPVIAPSGTTFYEGDMFPWQNNLLIGAMGVGGVVRIILNGNRVVGEERLLSEYGRVRDVEVTSDGAFWIVNDEGQLVRVSR
jgi:glucose/arabinose dehydrogenase